MNLNICQTLQLTSSLVIYGLLSGCGTGALIIGDLVVGGLVASTGQSDPEPWRTGKNHYEPIVLASNKDMIRIKYLSVGPNAEDEQVKRLIRDHCQGAYIETSRVELRGYDNVEAECAHDTDSLQ